jgi:hypothetical protein
MVGKRRRNQRSSRMAFSSSLTAIACTPAGGGGAEGFAAAGAAWAGFSETSSSRGGLPAARGDRTGRSDVGLPNPDLFRAGLPNVGLPNEGLPDEGLSSARLSSPRLDAGRAVLASSRWVRSGAERPPSSRVRAGVRAGLGELDRVRDGAGAAERDAAGARDGAAERAGFSRRSSSRVSLPDEAALPAGRRGGRLAPPLLSPKFLSLKFLEPEPLFPGRPVCLVM